MSENNEKIICLVISDSHGNDYALREALKYRGADAVIFLGDGLSDVECYAEADIGRCWLAVKGNGDFKDDFLGIPVKKTESITLAGKKIVFTHGDRYGVKFGSENLYMLAKDTEADIVLFGHTHCPHEEYHNGVYFFNPGTVGGAGGRAKSAGILTIDRGNVLFSVREL